MIRLGVLLLAALLCCSPVAAQSAHDLLAGETRGINPRYLLQDPNGRSVRLGDAWDERTVVLAFIRHFG